MYPKKIEKSNRFYVMACASINSCNNRMLYSTMCRYVRDIYHVERVCTMALTIKKIEMIILPQVDIEKALSWYESIGADCIKHTPRKWAELRVGEIIIALCPAVKEMQPRRSGIVFAVDDIYACYDAWKDTIQFLDKPHRASHGIIVSIQDPSGHIHDVYQPMQTKTCARACSNVKEGSCKNQDCAC